MMTGRIGSRMMTGRIDSRMMTRVGVGTSIKGVVRVGCQYIWY